MRPNLTHPRTGEPIVPLGYTRSGRPIWPVLGGSQPTGEPAPSTGATAPPAGEPTNNITVPATQSTTTTGGATALAGTAPAPNAGAAPEAQPQQPFRPGVPWRELPIEDQVEYWRAQSRKHEARHLAELGLKPGELEQLRAAAAERDRLVEAGRTDAERAVAEAEQRGRQAALAEVGSKLVDAHMRVAIGDRMGQEQVTALLSNLDLRRFQTESGDVNDAAVRDFVATILPAAAPASTAPATPAAGTTTEPAATAGANGQPGTGQPTRHVPDMGQGDRQIARPSGLTAGREIAAQRFGDKARSAARQ